ncbi:hypothetical protein A6F68_00063 [Tsuneonella dongtanensis]|uniref:TonB-dependent transporter Oar-like beta-barrel domain-containing protein n=1 Tax=Tsuneonella dongtanensis TaxID=692370 RepID=A0A1B2A8V4_9SPHN|nr:carboxypeptidase regulatory-like domain-containing protein [Tsuneonella dongtanensis]ANY18599.1 hypothetical protein A6F68_00063 [Tsuneonella dongtanensis]
MKLKYLLAASVVSLSATAILPAPVMAQQITSGIQGSVADEAGNAIPGATVTITDIRTGAQRSLTTGADGNFRADGLVTGGPYTVAANAGGFEGQTVEGVQLTLQGNADLSFALTAGGGEIVVSGARANLTTVTTGPGQSFGLAVLESVPTFERDLRDVIRIDPRVSLDRNQESDRVSCLGGNDRSNAFTVDGINQGDVYGLTDTPFSSRTGTPIPYDAIRETSVEFAPMDVTYGSFTGCAINAVTKSGSNDISGSAFITYSNLDLSGDRAGGVAANGVNRDLRFGGTLSGPIIKDRLFLFGAYERVDVVDAVESGPVGAGLANDRTFITQALFDQIAGVLNNSYGIDVGGVARTLPFKSDRYFVRADAYLSDNHRLEATYQHVNEAKVQADDMTDNTGLGRSTITGLNNFYASGSQSDYYSGRLYSNWSDNFSTEFGYSRSEITDEQSPLGGGEAQDENPITRIVVGVNNGTSRGLFVAGPGFSRSANRLSVSVDQFRAKGILNQGAHTLTFGAEMNKADLNNLFVQNGTGTLYFRDVNALIAGTPNNGTSFSTTDPAAVAAGTTIGADINNSRDGNIESAAAAFSRTIYTAFVQDEWDVTDRLNLIGGVRVDWYDGDRPRLNSRFVQRYGQANTIGFSNIDPVVAPRFALDYDAGDFGFARNLRIKAGVGVFSGGDPVVWFGNAFQNDGFATAPGNLNTTSCGTTNINVLSGGSFTGFPQCVRNSAQALAAQGGGDTQSIDPDIKMPSVLRYNLGLSATLGAGGSFFSGWNLNLDYIRSQYRNPLTLVDLSQVPDFRIGLNGFTIDGRPINRAIDPTVAGCTARLVQDGTAISYTNVNAACFSTSRDDELQLTNGGKYTSQIASAILAKRFERGLFTEGGSTFINIGYAFTDSKDRRSMYRSTAGSNYDGTAAFDRQNPPATRSFYSTKHNITLAAQFKEAFISEEAKTGFGFTFVARSGRPYSLTFGGSGRFYDSASGNDNALLYIPTGVNDPNLAPTSNAAAVQSLVNYIDALPCAKKYAGRTIERNSCSNEWYYDLDLNFSQEFPGPLNGRDKFRFTATLDNFLNFLDSDWNVFRRRDFEGLVNVVDTPSTPVDAQGRYIISSFAPDDAALVQPSSSLWRIKVGLSYDF